MKKIIAVILCAILLMSMVSCTSMEMLTDAGQKKYVFSRDVEGLQEIKTELEDEITKLEEDNKSLENDISQLGAEIEELEKEEKSKKGDLSTIQRRFDEATDEGFGIRYDELLCQMMYLMDYTNEYYTLSFSREAITSINDQGENVLEYPIASTKKGEMILSYIITLTDDKIHVKKASTKLDVTMANEDIVVLFGLHAAMMCTGLMLALDCPYYYDDTDEEFNKNIVALMLQGVSNDGRAKFQKHEIGDYILFEVEPSKKLADKKKY